MNFLKNVLLKIDLYGDHFQLKFGKDAKYKSACGGILTLLVTAALVFATIIFGYTFLQRSEFVTNRDEGYYTSATMPFMKGEDLKKSYIVLSLPNHFAMSLSKQAQFNDKTYELRECKEEELENISVSSIRTDLCLDLNDIDLGMEDVPDGEDKDGFPKFKRVNRKASLKFEFCKGEEACQLKDTDMFMVSVRIPLLTFNSSNYDNPIQLNWEDHSILAKGYHYNIFTTNFDSFLVDDDKGWLVSNAEKTKALSFGNTKFNAYKSKDPGFISIEFALTQKYDHFFRRFQKIQDLSALIGGFLKIVTTLLSVYNISYQKVLIEQDLMHKLFRTKFQVEIKDKKKSFVNPPAPNISIIDNYVKHKSMEKDRSDMDLDNKVKYKKTQKTVLVKSNSAVSTLSLPTQEAATKLNIMKHHFRTFLSCCSSRSMSKPVQKVAKGMSNIDQLRDFTYIAEKLLHFDLFMHLMLEEGEIDMINLSEKPVLHCETEVPANKFSLMDRVYSKMGTNRKELEKNVINYLRDKIQSEGQLNLRMSKLLMSMPVEMQEKVNRELEGIKGESK